MAEVRMIVAVSGTRDGADWPGRGELLACSAGEAADLVAAGMAELVESKRKSATMKAPEKATKK